MIRWGKSRLKKIKSASSGPDDEDIHREMAEELEHLRATMEAQSEMYATNVSVLRSAIEDKEKSSNVKELRDEINSMKHRLELKEKYSLDKERLGRIAKEQHGEMMERLEDHVRTNERRAEEAKEMLKRFEAEKEELHFREVNTLRENISRTKETISLLEQTYHEEKEQANQRFKTESKLAYEHKETALRLTQEESLISEEMVSSRRRCRRAITAKDEIMAKMSGTESEVSRLRNELRETNNTIERLQVEAQSRKRKMEAMKRELKRVSVTSSKLRPPVKSSSQKDHDDDYNDDDDDVEKARQRLESFYISKDPSNKSNITPLLRKFQKSSRVDLLMQIVESKYTLSSQTTNSQEENGIGFMTSVRKRLSSSSSSSSSSLTPSKAKQEKMNENDQLMYWGLQQQMIENEKLFSDELHAISVQQSMLRDRHRQDILRVKNQHELMLQKRLSSAREEHAEAMRKVKFESEMGVTRRLQIVENHAARKRRSEENKNTTTTEKKRPESSIPILPASPPRTPDPVLFILNKDRESSKVRSARARERAEQRRLMREKERVACREAAGDGGDLSD